MRAYHNDSKVKEDILKQLQAHYEADQIVQGVYWENGKGCAVGCTIHSSDHKEYESLFGIPKSLAYLEDTIFEGLPNKEAKDWPLRFMSAIPVGADLSDVTRCFLIAILGDEAHGVLRYTIAGSLQHAAVSNVIALLRDNCKDIHRCQNATAAAWEAAWATPEAAGAAGAAMAAAGAAGEAWAGTAATAAAGDAEWDAWVATWDAAWDAARAAGDAARAAARAATLYATWDARDAASAALYAAWDAAEAAHYTWMADTLIKLIMGVKVLPES